jgi:hypothetical protein
MFGKLFEPAFKGMSKFFSTDRVILVGIFLLLIWLLAGYAKSKTPMSGEGLHDGTPDNAGEEVTDETAGVNTASSNTTASGTGYTTSEVANPSDLLPSDENSQWSALNPAAAKKGDTTLPDLLKAGYHIGLDTIGQTLRNANLQLRSDPIINKAEVGPWNQSTIETDYARTPLEIGPCK